MIYAVIDYETMEGVYCGASAHMTAYHLEPGTVYGRGDTEEKATTQALERAASARRSHNARLP